MKILWVDTETTGLNPSENGVHQVAGLIELGNIGYGNLITFNINANPLSHCEVSTWFDKTKNCEVDALSISGKTKEDLLKYQGYQLGMAELLSVFSAHVDKFDNSDKFILAGYNVGYDKDMLFGWATDIGEKYLGSYIDHRVIDVASIARAAHAMGLFVREPENFQLGTLANHFGIAIDAHDALSDIEATRKLFFVLIGLIRDVASDNLSGNGHLLGILLTYTRV